MTATLWLLRHAVHGRVHDVLCGRMSGVHLNDAGRAQAADLAARLHGRQIQALYSSPRERARETASIIAERLRLSADVEPALDEIDYGDWTGQKFDELAHDPRWGRWNAAREAERPPGGESLAQVRARLDVWMGRLARRHPGQHVAAVSHAETIKAAVALALGLSGDAHERLDLPPGSICVISVGDWGRRVLCVNGAFACPI
ncbi:MAG: histidine phosphatase family protein [Phenylobacterium sp.]|uniref:histidine phosphatase family protein n=1 Tax=Phenylobacterium sp. TaxID=1871053 RepID=UPI00391C816E